MEDFAGWIAPAATMIAAMMTAANLGSRVTGWGFVVFAVGSVAWVAVALGTDQANLLYTNLFLTLVNLVGIYRWLGREARLDDGQAVARDRSDADDVSALFPVATLMQAPVSAADGTAIGRSVGAMAERASGRIAYLVVRSGEVAGMGGALHAIGWDRLRADGEGFTTSLGAEDVRRLPEVDPEHWPAEAPHGG